MVDLKMLDVTDAVLDGPSSPEEENYVPVSSETLGQSAHEMLDLFLEHEAIANTAQVGREMKYGELEEIGMLEDVPDEFRVVNIPGMDIFGQPVSKTNKWNHECECPKCKRTLAAARFAQHLEKCMGMGRNSSRIASRRLAAANTNSSNNNSNSVGAEVKMVPQGNNPVVTNQVNGDLGIGTDDEHISEDDDEDWTMEKKKKSKKGVEKGTPKRKGPVNRIKTNDTAKRKTGSPSVSVAASPVSSEVLSNSEDDFNVNVAMSQL